MARKVDVWAVEGFYGNGWENLFEGETWKSAWDKFLCFAESNPGHQHRVIKRKEVNK